MSLRDAFPETLLPKTYTGVTDTRKCAFLLSLGMCHRTFFLYLASDFRLLFQCIARVLPTISQSVTFRPEFRLHLLCIALSTTASSTTNLHSFLLYSSKHLNPRIFQTYLLNLNPHDFSPFKISEQLEAQLENLELGVLGN